ncbi:SET and MYND domain-containing protein DDB_G0273591-like [Sitodiplosis mosellana]|uniref:SET and MYND domain-containing protein DDB_G0273591-like n=1 Tax=Sitodiplosis mosellana TaxID=263140 RepID=UPI00244441AA|nr:SET and MYND domain-containing protein DDB_G0273591-like [Sitodiplosis mosellana]
MLWKKESIGKDARLVDFLDSERTHHKHIFSLFDDISESKKVLEKSGKLSTHYRKKAMSQLESKNWHEAIELLNEALCFAENDSQDVGGAYAERSTCFFNLHMYDHCLTDIKLARSSKCPQVVQAKLSKLRESCKKMLKISPNTEAEDDFKPTLSFDASEQCPFVANVVKIEGKEKMGRCITATRDIDVGQAIMVEEGFVWSTTENYRRCCVCLETTNPLVPCKNCTDSLMCFGKCEKNQLHEIECNMGLPTVNGKEVNGKEVNFQLVVRSILMALKTIPNLNELIRFVERIVSAEDNEPINSASTPLSRYAVFLENGLKWQWPKKENKTYIGHIKRIHEAFMDNDDFAELFEDDDHERFLRHLIGHHICALQYATPNVCIGENDGTSVHSIIGRFFFHSCYPNAVLVTSDRSTVAVTIRPIEKGEEVTVSYLPDELNRSTKYRRKWLLVQYNLMCFCSRCTQPATAASNATALSKLQKNELRNASNRDPKKQAKRRNLTVACTKYLNANGREQWCDDIYYMLHAYIQLLCTKYYLNLKH